MPKKRQLPLRLEGLLGSVGGGAASGFIMENLDQRIPVFQRNTQLSPWFNAALAMAIVFFGGERIKPVAFGMLGASGADFSGDLLQGLSRITNLPNNEVQGLLGNTLEENRKLKEDLGIQESELLEEEREN